MIALSLKLAASDAHLLRMEAARRGTQAATLARRILAFAVRDQLIDAIIDDDDRAPASNGNADDEARAIAELTAECGGDLDEAMRAFGEREGR
jgi:hypothetical protein